MDTPKGKDRDIEALLEQLVLELADLFPKTDEENDIKDSQ